jgi:hypothetical protein
MFVGYYKAVGQPKEFYSEKRKSLDFPMQVELEGLRYLLSYTIQITSSKQENSLHKMAQENGIKHNVKIG